MGRSGGEAEVRGGGVAEGCRGGRGVLRGGAAAAGAGPCGP